MSNLSFVYVKTPFSGSNTGEIFNIRTLVDFVGVLLLYAFHLQKIDAHAGNEMLAIKNILQNQYLQYRQSQENIDLINHKYHDLKNQLQVIRNETDHKKRNRYLDEIESGIRQYEAENKTGNTVLDTIFTEKSKLCLKHDITFTTVADGSLLNHIYVMDLCTIFGNALDNAIEYEVLIPDKEKRLIHVSISEKKNFITILIENHFEDELDIKNGLPKSTKSDNGYHGYGLKSIQYAAEKNGGFINVKVEEEWFKLQIIFPRN